MSKLAVYIRTSSKSLNNETQCETIRNCFGGCPIRVYLDIGTSSVGYRPAFEALLRDMANGEIGQLHVYSYDRISRSSEELLRFVETAGRHNVQIVIAQPILG